MGRFNRLRNHYGLSCDKETAIHANPTNKAGASIQSSPKNEETSVSEPTTIPKEPALLPSTTNSPESTSRGEFSTEHTLTTESSGETKISSITNSTTIDSAAIRSSPSRNEAGTNIKSSPRNEDTTSSISTSIIPAQSSTQKEPASSPSTTNSPESTSRGEFSTERTLTTESLEETTTSSSTNSATINSAAISSSSSRNEAGTNIKSSPRNEDTTSSISTSIIPAQSSTQKEPASSPSTTNSPESTSRGELSTELTLTTESSEETTTSSSTNSAIINSAAISSSPSRAEAGTNLKSSPSYGDTTSSISTRIIPAQSTTEKVCSDNLGIENSDIPDENIQASGHMTGYSPWKGRLNGNTIWAEHENIDKPWIQADVGYQTYVSGVITQGDGVGYEIRPDWVTTLKVSTFELNIADEEVFVKDDNGKVKIFIANTDRNTEVMSAFPIPVFARIVRITCLTKNEGSDNWNFRFEVVGCKHTNNAQ